MDAARGVGRSRSGCRPGVMGNSEVGHLTLGAGRMVPQDLLRIDLALRDGSFFENPVLRARPMRHGKRRGATLHLMGLLSDGGVHSHERHLEGLLELAARSKVSRVRVHAFTDGRDTPPRSARGYVERLEAALAKTGRQDRDGLRPLLRDGPRQALGPRGARLPGARLLVRAAAPASAAEADRGLLRPRTSPTSSSSRRSSSRTDEPGRTHPRRRRRRLLQLPRRPRPPDHARADRCRRSPSSRDRSRRASTSSASPSTRRTSAFPAPSRRGSSQRILADVWAEAGIGEPAPRRDREVRARHVLLQRRRREALSGRGAHPGPVVEGRDLRPPSRDERRRRSRRKRCARCAADASARHVVNFANADMVGHTGKLAGDDRRGRNARSLFRDPRGGLRGGAAPCCCMTADHGNAEQMIDPQTGAPHTAHTTNPVPVRRVRERGRAGRRRALADVAPTLLGLQGLEAPNEMTGRDLRRPAAELAARFLVLARIREDARCCSARELGRRSAGRRGSRRS